MPNLLPDWLPWIRPAGRLIWGSLALVMGLTFAVTLMKRPLLKRPFPDRVGYVAFPAIFVTGVVAAKVLTSVQTLVVWATVLALVGHGLLMVASSKGHGPEEPATWAESFAGALGVFALFVVGYAIVPSEWLNYANAYLQWGDTTKFIFKSSEQMLFLPWHWPFNLDYPALRDIVTTGIYLAVIGANLKLWVLWQRRHEVKEAPAAAEGAPARRSRFGRPLRVKG
jgi:phosphatidylglycerophosphate synthase